MVSEARERVDREKELVSSLERCKIDFEGYFLQPRQSSLHLDMNMSSLPPSPPGIETPPLSPGTISCICFLFVKSKC